MGKEGVCVGGGEEYWRKRESGEKEGVCGEGVGDEVIVEIKRESGGGDRVRMR